MRDDDEDFGDEEDSDNDDEDSKDDDDEEEDDDEDSDDDDDAPYDDAGMYDDDDDVELIMVNYIPEEDELIVSLWVEVHLDNEEEDEQLNNTNLLEQLLQRLTIHDGIPNQLTVKYVKTRSNKL
ncbi:uncharacterized protein LOC113324387 [Papaver somniferum]|uniref:uncharacterized protein LOC113324387 n=1 Tax=Papaver somniferum TaxID=3469 RepID=UPI000E6FF532|nr:uncharacterized protein LOC113324387 [Papaver somniferum]